MTEHSKRQYLNNLSEQILICRNCELCNHRSNAVPGVGAVNASVMFIGEAPGYNEDALGLPFVGAAGKLLTHLLEEIELSRESVFITNIVKCRPPKNRDPSLIEISQCEVYLAEQIELIDPLLIVPLGRFAMNYFITDGSITKIAGQVQKIKGRNIYPVLHPAAALRRTEFRERLRRDISNIPRTLYALSKGNEP